MEIKFGKVFKLSLLFIFIAEALSLAGFLHPLFNKAGFFLILAVTLALSLWKKELGIYILLAELFVGSKGYLFYYDFEGFTLSIRIALWLIVMSVWLGAFIIKSFKKKRIQPLPNQSLFLIFFLFLAWGLARAFLNGNELNNIFFDFNNWLYFVLIFPLIYFINNKNKKETILSIFTASAIWLSFETLILLFAFSHNSGPLFEIYRWIRTTGVGEITRMQGGFSRIFFQSHIYVLIAFFLFLFRLVNNSLEHKKETRSLDFALVTIFLSVIVISFSRSFWVGLTAGISVLFVYHLISIFKKKIFLRGFLKIWGGLILSGILSLCLIFLIVEFPIPRPTANLSSDLTTRLSNLSGEAGISSRWALLPVVWTEIKQAPLVGKGFGSTVTYKSSDPRVLEANPAGNYTTYAFEWGWLDIWLKLGFFGALAYLVLIFRLIIKSVRSGENVLIALGIGLFVVTIVSIFSPYMNHPLGIGYLLIVNTLIDKP